MRSPSLTPNAVTAFDVTVHVVLDDFGKIGRAYRETDEQEADLETILDDFLTGQYNRPIRVVAFNTTEGWSRDVSEDIAWEVLARAARFGRRVPKASWDFVTDQVGEEAALRRANVAE